jgi:hypothetical protein
VYEGLFDFLAMIPNFLHSDPIQAGAGSFESLDHKLSKERVKSSLETTASSCRSYRGSATSPSLSVDLHLTTLARSLLGPYTQVWHHNMVLKAPQCTHLHTAANQKKLKPLSADLLG